MDVLAVRKTHHLLQHEQLLIPSQIVNRRGCCFIVVFVLMARASVSTLWTK